MLGVCSRLWARGIGSQPGLGLEPRVRCTSSHSTQQPRTLAPCQKASATAARRSSARWAVRQRAHARSAARAPKHARSYQSCSTRAARARRDASTAPHAYHARALDTLPAARASRSQACTHG